MIEGLVLLDMASVIALLFMVLIGLPHGAFDGAIANHLGAGRSFAAAAKFIASYCAAAGLVIAIWICLLYTSPSPRDGLLSRMPSSA